MLFISHTKSFVGCDSRKLIGAKSALKFKPLILLNIFIKASSTSVFDQFSCMIISQSIPNAGLEVIKLFPCSIQLSKKFILLINVKMPTIVGILIFIDMINTRSYWL